MGQRSRTPGRRESRRRQSALRPVLTDGGTPPPAGARVTGPGRAPVPEAGRAADPRGPDEADARALVVTHRFDPGPPGGPAVDVVIRLTGRRRGVTGIRTATDTFARTVTIPRVLPGSGPIATTSWVYGIAAGDWEVEAELLGPRDLRRVNGGSRLAPAAWSWRSRALVPAPGLLRTRWAPLAPLAAAPAVVPGSFTALALLAIVAAVAVQPVFLGRLGLDAPGPVLASLVGLLAGLAGAKAWYMVLKGPSWRTAREGWSVDGFLVTAPVAAVLAALPQGIPAGAYLEAITPGIFVAVAIGRVGCFLTGCCAGRPTAGWGIWSSDRRVAARRVPAQLLEAGLGILLAVASGAAVLGGVDTGSGAVFLAAILAYGLTRQALLRIRAEARPFSWRRGPVRVTG